MVEEHSRQRGQAALDVAAFSRSGDIPLTEFTHDRAGHLRTNGRWLREVWASGRARVVVVDRGNFPLASDGKSVGWNAPSEVPDGRRVFLGLDGGVPHFALLTCETRDGRRWTDLQHSGSVLSSSDTGLMVHATALAEWHHSHRHCSRCGANLDPQEAGHALHCLICGRREFPRTDPAVIMLVTHGDRVLLGRQAEWPPGRYSTLAGFVEPGESLEHAVSREVMEETGVEVADATFFASQPWPFPHSLMVAYFARAQTSEINVDGTEISDAQWFTRAQVKVQCEEGTLTLPGGVSLSRALLEAWYGGVLPGLESRQP